MPNNLRCKIEDCHVLQATVPSPGVTAGDMDMVEDTIYFWLSDGDTGDTGVKVIEAERVILPAASAATFSVGDYVYYDDSTNDLNGTGAGRYRCGICRVAKVALETTVEVDFYGNDAIAV